MITGKVIGNIVSTQKHAKLVGYKLLLVETTDGAAPLVAVDTLGAGRGVTVLLCTGSSARAALGDPEAPIDAVIVGIVDSVEKGQ